LKIVEEIVIGVHSTWKSGLSGSRVIDLIVGVGGGEGAEGLKDKVFELWAVEVEVIFEEEEYVEWGDALSSSIGALLLLLLISFVCFFKWRWIFLLRCLIVGGGG